MYTKPMNLDRKIVIDLQGGDDKGLPDLFGVEVELEGRSISTKKEAITGFWKAVPDGSLRALKPGSEALEYIFRDPLTMEFTDRALAALFDFLNTPPAEVFDSYRTSVHVHVNCRQETARTVWNFITLAIILDELLVSQNGEHRVGNNFCLRAKDAQGFLHSLVDSINAGGTFWHIERNERYTSVNIASLAKFGTIEFRSLECTTNHSRVMHWVKTLQAMKEAARGFSDPREIISMYSRFGPNDFLFRVLGQQALKYVRVPGMQDMLHRGMRLAQDLAYCSQWINRTKDDYEAPPKQQEVRINRFVRQPEFVNPLEAADEPAVEGDDPWQAHVRRVQADVLLRQAGLRDGAFGLGGQPAPAPRAPVVRHRVRAPRPR